MDNTYTALGAVYDRLISGYPYQKVADKIISQVTGKGFDIGSGSGIITVDLAKAGLQVIAVEPSAKMLEKAIERAKRERVNPVFVNANAESVDLTSCNFVVATCDVMNYMPTKSAFEKFVKKVYEKLKPDGKFVFDIRRADILNSMIGEVYYEDYGDLTYLWTNSKKGEKLVMDIVFFQKDRDDKYTRIDEKHEFLMMTDEYIQDFLTKVGFKVKVYGDKLGAQKKSDKRSFYFCEK